MLAGFNRPTSFQTSPSHHVNVSVTAEFPGIVPLVGLTVYPTFPFAAITNATGTLCYDADFYPLGGELAFTNNCSQSYKFAGMEQDSETGEYHTLFRQYASNLGRWLSPDPLGGSVANPQSLNRYAYALNNPTTLTDPLGPRGLRAAG